MLLSLLLLPVACRTPSDTPVAENQFGEAGALATSSERRLVLYDRARGRVVAEPDRDAIQELAAAVEQAFEEALAASAPEERVQREERLAQLLEASLAEAPARGGVALFRAGSWRLSEAYFNGVLADEEVATLFRLLFERSADLVELELLGAARGDADLPRPRDVRVGVDEGVEVPREPVDAEPCATAGPGPPTGGADTPSAPATSVHEVQGTPPGPAACPPPPEEDAPVPAPRRRPGLGRIVGADPSVAAAGRAG